MNQDGLPPVTTSWEAISFSPDFVRQHMLDQFPWIDLSFNKQHSIITIRFSRSNVDDRKRLRVTTRGGAFIRDKYFVYAFGESEWTRSVLYRGFTPRQLKSDDNEKRFSLPLKSAVKLVF